MTIEKRVSDLEKAIIKVEEREKSNTTRLNEVDAELKENNSLVSAIKELAIETKYMRTDLNETIQRLAKLESKDAEKWDKFKWLIVAGMATVIIGFVAVQVGLR
jgi:Flp pilus assembly protein TadB